MEVLEGRDAQAVNAFSSVLEEVDDASFIRIVAALVLERAGAVAARAGKAEAESFLDDLFLTTENVRGALDIPHE